MFQFFNWSIQLRFQKRRRKKKRVSRAKLQKTNLHVDPQTRWSNICGKVFCDSLESIDYDQLSFGYLYCYVHSEKSGSSNRIEHHVAKVVSVFSRGGDWKDLYRSEAGSFESASSILRSCNDRYCTVTLGQGSRRDRIGISRPLRSAIFRVFPRLSRQVSFPYWSLVNNDLETPSLIIELRSWFLPVPW